MSNADLTQYNGTQAFPTSADVGTNADQYLVPTDGKLITALSNILNEAPVNVALHRLKDYVLGLRGAIIGDFAFANLKTVKSLNVDGSGGQPSAASTGSILVSGSSGTGTSVPTSAHPAGTIFPDTSIFGWARGYWDGANMVLMRGFNVKTVVRNGLGNYTITFHPVINSPTTAMVSITMGPNPSVVARGFVGNVLTTTDDGAGRLVVNFVTVDPNTGSYVDTTSTSWFFIEAKGY